MLVASQPSTPKAEIDFTICLPAENAEVVALANCIAAEYHEPADTIIWRDAFCHDCGMNECALGTALQLARKIYALDWVTVTGNLYIINLNCSSCAGYEPPATDDEIRADMAYAEWKDA